MADLLIRDLEPATHRELKRRADQAGMSLQTYISRLLEQHNSRPSLSEWVQRLDEMRRHPEISGAESVHEARRDLP